VGTAFNSRELRIRNIWISAVLTASNKDRATAALSRYINRGTACQRDRVTCHFNRSTCGSRLLPDRRDLAVGIQGGAVRGNQQDLPVLPSYYGIGLEGTAVVDKPRIDADLAAVGNDLAEIQCLFVGRRDFDS